MIARRRAAFGPAFEPRDGSLDERDSGRAATARDLYGARGWVAHHNTDAWAFTAPVGRGRADPSWSFWPLGGVWLTWLLHDLRKKGKVSKVAPYLALIVPSFIPLFLAALATIPALRDVAHGFGTVFTSLKG